MQCSNMIEELPSFARGEKNFNLANCEMGSFIAGILDVLKMEAEKKGVSLSSKIEYTKFLLRG